MTSDATSERDEDVTLYEHEPRDMPPPGWVQLNATSWVRASAVIGFTDTDAVIEVGDQWMRISLGFPLAEHLLDIEDADRHDTERGRRSR